MVYSGEIVGEGGYSEVGGVYWEAEMGREGIEETIDI